MKVRSVMADCRSRHETLIPDMLNQYRATGTKTKRNVQNETNVIIQLSVITCSVNCKSITLVKIIYLTLWTFYNTLQEYQKIPTNATVSKNSDFGFIMVIYETFSFLVFSSIWEKWRNSQSTSLLSVTNIDLPAWLYCKTSINKVGSHVITNVTMTTTSIFTTYK